jgi:uncharacterized protein (TIGR03067 family)
MRIAVAISIVVTVIGLVHGGDSVQPLQGTWEVVELTAYGMKVDPKEFAGTKFVFEKDKLTILPGKEKIEQFLKLTFTVKVNPKKKPAEVDLVALDGKHKGVVSPGIYEVKGDTLRWCQPDGAETKARPTDFASPEKSDIYLFTLKRVVGPKK